MKRRQAPVLDVIRVQLETVAAEQSRIRSAVEAHEQWHRDTATAKEIAARSRRIAVIAVIVAALAVIVQVGSTVGGITVR